METWSAGKAVLQGMGLEITRDFLFFDLLVVLLEEKETFLIFVLHTASEQPDKRDFYQAY